MFTLQSLPCRCSRLQPLPERGLQRRPTLSLGAPQKRFLGVVRGAHVQTRMQASTSQVDFKVERSPSEDAVIRAVTPFHLAIPVNDIPAARAFYGDLLGLPEGRSSERWVDYNFYGHQLVCHLVDGYNASSSANAVDGDPVPVPHFGLAMTAEAFAELAERVASRGIVFELEPHVRFKGAPGEQRTMFFRDPSGNALEFKAMTTPDNLFAQYSVKKG